MNHHCPICSKPLRPRQVQYCSRQCSGQGQRLEPSTCKRCCKKFQPRTRHIRHCSEKCRIATLTEKQRATIVFLKGLPAGTNPAKALAQANGIRVQSAQGQINRLIAKGLLSVERMPTPVLTLLHDVAELIRSRDWPVKDYDWVLNLKERLASLGV